MLCLSCNKNRARKIEPYGWMICKSCTNKQKNIKIKETIEIVTNDILESRKEHKKDILQPFRGGQVSKEYVKAYGAKNIQASPEEIKNARNVWTENSYYQEG